MRSVRFRRMHRPCQWKNVVLLHGMNLFVGAAWSRADSPRPIRMVVEDLAMINQIGLTDARAGRPWRGTSEVYAASLKRDYEEILRGMRAYVPLPR